ncbi:MAG: cytochrome c [Myxococcales bacterium]|nr:cytochrome c [Myxococcales bacterium]
MACRPHSIVLLSCLTLFAPACGDDGSGTDGATNDTGGMDEADTTGDTAADTSDTNSGMSGQELYTSFCSACHGPEGEGSSIAYEIRHPHHEFSRWVVRNGRTSIEFAGQAMPVFSDAVISDADLDLIFAYLDDFPQPDTGEGLYLDYCRNCHGADGNGGVVGKDVKNSPIQDFIENTRQGFGGSNYGSRNLYMPARPASDISDAEIQQIFDYVQTL